MDSGVFILNFSTCRKVLSLLKFITGLHLGEACVLETGDCKTREILHFPPFRPFHPFSPFQCSLTVETGCNGPRLGPLGGPCILILSEKI